MEMVLHREVLVLGSSTRYGNTNKNAHSGAQVLYCTEVVLTRTLGGTMDYFDENR